MGINDLNCQINKETKKINLSYQSLNAQKPGTFRAKNTTQYPEGVAITHSILKPKEDRTDSELSNYASEDYLLTYPSRSSKKYIAYNPDLDKEALEMSLIGVAKPVTISEKDINNICAFINNVKLDHKYNINSLKFHLDSKDPYYFSKLELSQDKLDIMSQIESAPKAPKQPQLPAPKKKAKK